MAECVERALLKKANYNILHFTDAITAMSQLDDAFPDLIFLDVLLNGPNGFTLLNELSSYLDTAKIPIILLSSLDLQDANLSEYNIVQILHKDTMTPTEIQEAVRRVL